MTPQEGYTLRTGDLVVDTRDGSFHTVVHDQNPTHLNSLLLDGPLGITLLLTDHLRRPTDDESRTFVAKKLAT